jgi:hypothetical protein
MTGIRDINNGLYNALVPGLGVSPQSFQLIQPSPPLLAGNDSYLWWNYFNHMSPYSLTQNYIASGGNQLFADCAVVMSTPTSVIKNRFVQDVGQDVATMFMEILATPSTPPDGDVLPVDRFVGHAIDGRTLFGQLPRDHAGLRSILQPAA